MSLVFVQAPLSLEHVNEVRIVRCSKCNAANLSSPRHNDCWKCKGFSMEKHFENHDIEMAQHNQIVPEPNDDYRYKCTLCNEEMSEHKIVEHQRANHSESTLPFTVDQYQLVPPTVKCDICQSTMYPANFDEHMRRYHAVITNVDETKMESMIGKDQQNSENGLKPCQTTPPLTHLSAAVELEPTEQFDIIFLALFKCNICNVVGISEENLQKHHSINHAELRFDLNKFELFALENTGQYLKCNLCHAHCHRSQVATHPSKCDKQSKLNEEVSSITQNNILLEKIYKCKICADEIQMMSLQEHRSNKHIDIPNEKSIFRMFIIELREQCPICGNEFNAGDIENHLRQIHHEAIIGDANIEFLNNNNTFQATIDNEEIVQLNISANFNKLNRNDLPLNDHMKDDSVAKHSQPVTESLTKKTNGGNDTMVFETFNAPMETENDCNTGSVMNMEQKANDMNNNHQDTTNLATLKTQNSDQLAKIKCNICGNQLKKKRLDSHMKRVHQVHQMSFGKQCNAIDGSPHVKSTSKMLVKTAAKEQSSTPSNITLQQYTCRICGAAEILHQNLQKHAKKHHQNHTDIFVLNGSTKRDQCNICQRIMKSGTIKSHKHRYHSTIRSSDMFHKNKIESQITKNRPFSSYAIQTTHTFNVFTKNVYKCNVCGVHKIEANKFKQHRHKGNEPDLQLTDCQEVIRCNCNKTFAINAFVWHMKREHPNIRYCYIQNERKIFPSNNDNAIENILRIFSCNLCKTKHILEKDCAKHHFKRHQTIPFSSNMFTIKRVKIRCKICTQFLNENRMECHTKKFHTISNDSATVMQYKCSICEVLVLDSSLKEHFANRHQGMPFITGNFKYFATKEKRSCHICGKMMHEGRNKKHHLKACLRARANGNMNRNEEKLIKNDLKYDQRVYNLMNGLK